MRSNLDEDKITKLATYHISATDIEPDTIKKNFKTAGTPTKAFVYADVPELTYEVKIYLQNPIKL